MSLLRFLHSSGSPAARELMGPRFVNKIFDDPFFSSPLPDSVVGSLDNAAFTRTPSFDVKETDKAFLLQGELPGVDKNNLELEFVDPQTLSVRAKIDKSQEFTRPESDANKAIEGSSQSANADNTVATKGATGDSSTFWASERVHGEFARQFRFPATVNSNDVSASLRNGILNIKVPKQEESANHRRIEVADE
ncbi:HSP20-like chaperone [Dipodascopsis uninucleata]